MVEAKRLGVAPLALTIMATIEPHKVMVLGYNLPPIRDGPKPLLPYLFHCLQLNTPESSLRGLVHIMFYLPGTDQPTGTLVQKCGETGKQGTDIRALSPLRVRLPYGEVTSSAVPLTSALAW